MIGHPFDVNGIFSIYIVILFYILYAEDNNYIPIVDMQHHNNIIFKDKRAYKDNPWEYFFKQPAGLGLSDIKDSTEIVFSDPNIFKNKLDNKFINLLREYANPELKESNPNIFDKIEISDEMKEYLEKSYSEITGNDDEILGIIYRGTDYTYLRPKNHPIQPDIEDVIAKAKEVIRKYNLNKIYLATEDENVYEKFKAEFGEMLLDNNQYKFTGKDKLYIKDYPKERENHFYNLNKEYFHSIYILSKCKYFISGISGGTYGVMALSKGFKNQKYTCIWDIGFYKRKNTVKYENFRERIFSVKNIILYEDKEYDVVTILGIKIKIFKKSLKNNTLEFERDLSPAKPEEQ